MSCSSFWACPLRLIAIAYLIGSIPFGWLMGKLVFKSDIRKAGSGNIGATNALRNFGTVAGIIVLLLDFGKGFAVAWFAKGLFAPMDYWIPIVGASVIIGHIFPIWLNFKGGKGVATAAGVFAVFMPWAILSALLVFIIAVALSRYVSVGSLCAAAALLVHHIVYYALKGWDLPMLIFVLLLVIMVYVKHIPNLKRLASGTENRFSFSRKGNR